MKKMDAPLPLRELRALERTSLLAARAAGRVLAKNFGTRLQVREKPQAGLVTNADLAAEAAALGICRRRHPAFGVLAEESGASAGRGSAREPEGRWILDPLDGTTNFVHGFPMFCVSIAAEWQGQVVVGVIYHPILKDTYVAVRGHGAFLNGKRMHVSKTDRLEHSLLSTGFTYGKSRWINLEMQAFTRLSDIARAIRRPGSAALDLAYTACGVFDGFWERQLSPWDVAAGSLLVEEAGGKVTDFHGDPFRVDAREILATNPRLHPLLRETIAPEPAARPTPASRARARRA